MNRLTMLLRSVAALCCGVLLCGAPAAQTVDRQVLNLAVGQAHILEEPGVRRIVVGNGKIIQATSLEGRQVLIVPEAVGQSSLHLWGRSGGEKQWLIQVHDGGGQQALSELQGLVTALDGISARIVGERVIVAGQPLTEEQSHRVSELARRFPQIVDLSSRVALERMIAMDVKMVEVRREAMRNLGVKWGPSAQGPSFGIIGDIHRSSALQPGGAASSLLGLDIRPRVAPFATHLSWVSSFTSMLNLMVQNGDAAILAEPQLSCRSGGTARLVAGGELPIPVSSGLGATSVMFKEYGVKFDVSPVATEQGMISARVATEISAINFDVVVREIPGLIKRRAETEVNLRENETLVVAGLVSEESSGQLDRVSGLGDLPILGPLFRSRLFRERRTELVVFITPRIVDANRQANREQLERSHRLQEVVRERMTIAE